jgi:hypothetical protein
MNIKYYNKRGTHHAKGWGGRNYRCLTHVIEVDKHGQANHPLFYQTWKE